MSQKIIIHNSELNENQLILHINGNEVINQWKPSGQMLVDSDHFSFIYIIDTGDQFSYLGIEENYWKSLKEALEKNLPVFISVGDNKIELVNFHDEMKYLIENIKGNSNYGEEMVTKVETTFF